MCIKLHLRLARYHSGTAASTIGKRTWLWGYPTGPEALDIGHWLETTKNDEGLHFCAPHCLSGQSFMEGAKYAQWRFRLFERDLQLNIE